MAYTEPEFRESGYFIDLCQEFAKRKNSDYEFNKEGVLSKLSKLESKTSDYQMKPLRTLQPVRTSSTYSYFDPKEEKNLARDDPSIIRANLVSQKELLRRVQNLKGGYFIPTIINQQLYFVRSNDDDIRTASESPSMTDVRTAIELQDESVYVYTGLPPSARSSEGLHTAANSQALTSSGERYYDTAVSGVLTALSASSFSDGLTTCNSSEPATALSFPTEHTAIDDLSSSDASTAKSFASDRTATALSFLTEHTAMDDISSIVASTAKSFATEHTAMDADTSVITRHENSSYYMEPTSGVETAIEISDSDRMIAEQNRLRQMGYAIPSQLDTRLLPRPNASSTEVDAQNLAKTPVAFDQKVSEYGRNLGSRASEHSMTGESAFTALSEESSHLDI